MDRSLEKAINFCKHYGGCTKSIKDEVYPNIVETKHWILWHGWQ